MNNFIIKKRSLRELTREFSRHKTHGPGVIHPEREDSKKKKGKKKRETGALKKKEKKEGWQ